MGLQEKMVSIGWWLRVNLSAQNIQAKRGINHRPTTSCSSDRSIPHDRKGTDGLGRHHRLRWWCHLLVGCVIYGTNEETGIRTIIISSPTTQHNRPRLQIYYLQIIIFNLTNNKMINRSLG